MTRFDWTATLLGAMFTSGLFLDGWAHSHGRVDTRRTSPPSPRRGIGWSPHLWLGAVVFAGIIGWLVSYLVLLPRVASSQRPNAPQHLPPRLPTDATS